ncbi:Nitrogen permease regulator 2-like protein [Smittium culicis]|uniref:Nitrogen permease regulator 2-like protein n=1 Tax=Smittium culicis TaxID=133412 RepID=A0A1R1XDI8_9FUNG|nr:Nitrogen permease regulator 2-like protein [Smittium culicis]OMJ13753.1 Nitrogen permease regulator 2-like protein [Smittium culicis]
MIKQIPQIFSIFLVKFHAVRGPEIDFVIPKEKSYIIAGYPQKENKKTNNSSTQKLPSLFPNNSQNALQDPFALNVDTNFSNSPIQLSSSKPQSRRLSSTSFPPSISASDSSHLSNIHNAIDFNSISSILMPKQVLYERVIKIHHNGYIILGYPVGVRGPYERNALIFNFCFVLKEEVDSSIYNAVVKRFGQLMKGLEIKMGFLRNKIYKSSLKLLVEKLKDDLNMFGESQILLKLPVTSVGQDQSNVEFNIKIFPSFEKIIQVNPYDVPILIINANDLVQEGDDHDIGMERVIRHINNINHVRRISQLADISENRVIYILQHLHYYGCIKFTEIFQVFNFLLPLIT